MGQRGIRGREVEGGLREEGEPSPVQLWDAAGRPPGRGAPLVRRTPTRTGLRP